MGPPATGPCISSTILSDAVELNQITTLATHLLCADEIVPARHERTRAARDVEAIVAHDSKLVGEEDVSRLLKRPSEHATTSTLGRADDHLPETGTRIRTTLPPFGNIHGG